MQDADPLFEPFEQAHLGVVALDNPLGREQLDQNFDEQALVAFGALAECLHDEVIAVAVDNQRGQQVCLAVDQRNASEFSTTRSR